MGFQPEFSKQALIQVKNVSIEAAIDALSEILKNAPVVKQKVF